MKSLLQEASSVSTAIEKAWVNASKPVEFTIKVLAEGEKSFLGLSTKSPAIISLIYDPKKQTAPLLEKQRRPQISNDQSRQRSYSAKASKDRQQKKPNGSYSAKATNDRQQPRRREIWNTAFISSITDWLKEATRLMGVTIPFTSKVERRTLFITFEKPIIENENDEKMLMSSFAILFLHALQKQQKRKLSEHRIMITSKRP